MKKHLFYYEYRKLIHHNIFLLLFLLLLLLNFWFAWKLPDENAIQSEKEMTAFLEEYRKDPIAMDAYMEKYRDLFESAGKRGDGSYPPNVYSDFDRALFNRFDKLRNFTYTYRETLENAKKVAESRLLEYEYLGYSPTSFEVIYQNSVIDSYEPLENLAFPVENLVGYDWFYSYSGFGLLLLLGVGLLAIRTVGAERSASMMPILKATKMGRCRTMVAKLTVGCSVTAILCLLFTGTTLLAIALRMGLVGWNLPIQMIGSMQFCPYQITIGEGILLLLAMQIFTSCAFFTVIAFFATWIRGTVGSYVATLVFIGVNFAIARYDFFNTYSFLRNMNLFWTLDGMKMISVWRGVKLFGTGIGVVPLWLMVYGCILLVFALSSVFSFANGKEGGRSRIFFRAVLPKWQTVFPKKPKYKTGIYRFELKKVLSAFACTLFLAASVLTVYLSEEEYHLTRDFDMNYYTEYMESIKGEWTPEKHAQIEEDIFTYQALLREKEAKAEAYKKGEITQNEYGRYLNNLMDAEVRNPTVRRIYERSLYLQEKTAEGYTVSFFDDTGWNQLREGNLSYITCALVILLIADLFAMEKRSGFEKMQRATVNGRGKVILTKFAVCITVAVAAGFVSEIIQFAFVSLYSGLQNGSAIAFSMQIDSSLSVTAYFITAACKNILLYIVLAVVTAGISFFTKRLLLTLSTVTVLVYAPMIFAYFGLPIFQNLSFINLFVR